MRCGCANAAVAAVVALGGAGAAGAVTVVSLNVVPLREQIAIALAAQDNSRAAELIDRHIRENPSDGGMHYNAACIAARLGERDQAAAYLMGAIKAGFAGFSRIRRDADLIPLRDHRTYQVILRARDAADGLLAQRRLDEWQSSHPGDEYVYARDESRRLNFAAALDDDAFAMVQTETALLVDHLGGTLFPGGHASTVLIALPGDDEARSLLRHGHAGGVYQHDRGLLIARGAAADGLCLRHELTHLMHHRHMDARGQQHPIWIQEGLASLYESAVLDADGNVTFSPSERDTIARYLESRNELTGWSDLMTMAEGPFNASAARLYPQARSIMLFLAERSLLGRWYERYVEHFAEDASGLEALEAACGLSGAEIERQWRQWLATMPIVREGGASGAVAGSEPRIPAGSR